MTSLTTKPVETHADEDARARTRDADRAIPDIRLERVTKRFHEVVAVDDLSLDVERGEFFSLLGPSGCGKTTTLRMIAGFEEVTAGTIRLGEKDVTNTAPYRRDVNTVFQNYALFPHLNVFENVAFGLRRHHVRDAELRRKVTEFLALVELPGYERRKTSQLSGGQQQRVALARALINHPRVLLLDEPLGALDLKLRKQMQLELKRIQTEVGITFVYVTHDQEEAMTMSDRIAVMRAGRIEQLGSAEELYERPATQFVAGFLGVSNLLEGRVVRAAGGTLDIELATGQRIRAVEAGATNAGGAHVGATVRVGVRPEKLKLSALDAGAGNGAAPRGDANTLEGRVTDASYVGVSTQYIIRLDSGKEVSVYAQNLETSGVAEQHAVGQLVSLTWLPKHTFVVGRGADESDVASVEEEESNA
jgi:spermidine/putrescine transport system ATP-binding protein